MSRGGRVVERIRVSIALWLVSSLTAGVVQAEEPVNFPDEVLRAAVENKLEVYEPTPQDMLNLTSLKHVMSFKSQDEGITDLSGLEFAVNLRDLNLRLNKIVDLAPLAGLTYLQTLNLSQNEIYDLLPLAALSDLVDLNIHANHIDDISVLAGLTGLRDLDLHTNRIFDLAPLSDLANLQTLIALRKPNHRYFCLGPALQFAVSGSTLERDSAR